MSIGCPVLLLMGMGKKTVHDGTCVSWQLGHLLPLHLLHLSSQFPHRGFLQDWQVTFDLWIRCLAACTSVLHDVHLPILSLMKGGSSAVVHTTPRIEE